MFAISASAFADTVAVAISASWAEDARRHHGFFGVVAGALVGPVAMAIVESEAAIGATHHNARRLCALDVGWVGVALLAHLSAPSGAFGSAAVTIGGGISAMWRVHLYP